MSRGAEGGPLESETPRPPPSPASRQPVEFLVVLLLGVLLFRGFAAEAYLVPTGSMAPTLLGMHREVTCDRCRLGYAVGVDEQGHSGRAVCPNCGETDAGVAAVVERIGDRLLVQKFLFDWRPPRRWEVAVFQNPAEPVQAYVKRVVGRPGESIQIVRGDVFINGRIARKSLDEQRAMRQLVFDARFPRPDSDRTPRWTYHPAPGASGWRAVGNRFERAPGATGDARPDWLEYRHWDPDREAYGPVRDFNPYNGGEYRGDNRVSDLTLSARVLVRPGATSLLLRLLGESDRLVATIPVDGAGALKVEHNGKTIPVSETSARLTASDTEAPRAVLLEASWVDRRLIVALDGRPLFAPIDLDDPPTRPDLGAPERPIAIGAAGSGGVTIWDVRIDRDVYYTGVLAGAPRRPFGVEVPYRLGPGEYFVLGDNSPVSNDSRFWATSPVVKAEALLGKPFLVHLPSRAVPLKVFGGPTYWVPDPREIRYIR